MSCASQGIQPGWVDNLDCQWLDITDVEPGVTTVKEKPCKELSFVKWHQKRNCFTGEQLVVCYEDLMQQLIIDNVTLNALFATYSTSWTTATL
ncbi:Lysyl oxidase 3 [Balamuthia mandrillaris]